MQELMWGNRAFDQHQQGGCQTQRRKAFLGLTMGKRQDIGDLLYKK